MNRSGAAKSQSRGLCGVAATSPPALYFLLLALGCFSVCAQTQNRNGQTPPVIMSPPEFYVQVDDRAITVRGNVQITVDPSSYKIYVCVWHSEHEAAGLGCDPQTAAKIKNSPDNSVAVNKDGSFQATLQDKLPPGSFLSVEIGGKDHASITYSPVPAVESTARVKRDAKDFVMNADQEYCDQALPSQYRESVLAVAAPRAWQGWLKRETDNPDRHQQSGTEVRFVDGIRDFGDANVRDPIKHETINDAGYAVFSEPTRTFDATEAQRLLVRLLFLNNPSRAACSYAYLTGNVPRPGAPALDSTGKAEDIFSRGAGKPWSMRDRRSPKYYLINVVRWVNAPATGHGGIAGGPAYQAVSDDWYLLNYSDAAAHHRDLASALRKFRPKLEHDTMRILGRSDVVLIGIHLAPKAADPGLLPITDAGIRIMPTEQAWYDRVKIQYRIHASAAEPAQIEDLGSLISIFLNANARSARETSIKQEPFDCHPPGGLQQVEFQSAVLAKIRNVLQNAEPLRWFLAGSDRQLQSFVAGDAAIMNSLCADKRDGKGHPQACIQGLRDLETELSKTERSIRVAPATCEAWVHVQQHLEKTSRAPIYSLYQGLYGAGFVSNLRSLPVRITGSWDISFAETNAGDAGALKDDHSDTATQTARLVLRGLKAGRLADTRETSMRPRQSSANLNCAVSAANDVNETHEPCTSSSSSIQDEGLTWWDISVAVTAPGYSDLKLQSSSTGHVLSVNSVTRFNAYAMLDLYLLGKQDVLDRPYLGFPHLSVGLPFAGKPFGAPYFAIGETVNLPKALSRVMPFGWRDEIGNYFPVTLRPLLGWVWNKEPVTTAASPTIIHEHRALKPQWALELSIKDIKNVASKLGKGE